MRGRANVIIDLMRRHGCESYAEIGVKQGRTLKAVVDALHVPNIAVDPFENIPNAAESYDHWDFDSIWQEFKESAQRMRPPPTVFKQTSLAAAERVRAAFPSGIDFVFIDGAHDFDNVLADIMAWYPLTNKIIAGHDYNAEKFPGVVQAVQRQFQKINVAADDVWWVDKWAERL